MTAFYQVLDTVSIHAPVWGATKGARLGVEDRIVSIHAPVWGATIGFAVRMTVGISFNPRTRVGCDKI